MNDPISNKKKNPYKKHYSQLEQQQEFNKILLEKLNQQNEYIKESLEQRDQRLLESIRSIQEQKQAQLEVAASTPKQGFFSRLFGKK